jgi:hypothetical protein
VHKQEVCYRHCQHQQLLLWEVSRGSRAAARNLWHNWKQLLEWIWVHAWLLNRQGKALRVPWSVAHVSALWHVPAVTGFVDDPVSLALTVKITRV